MSHLQLESTGEAEFHDLEIRLLGLRDNGYPVEITLDGEQEFPRGYLDASVIPWIPGCDPATDGRRLFDALFADDRLKIAWAESRGRAPRHRIRLRIDLDAAELHALPWELLQEDQAIFSAQADTPLSRYLPVALPWSGPVEERPIRLLIVISAPDDLNESYGLPEIDAARERQCLEDALAAVDPGDLQVDFLDAPATLRRLEETLCRGNYHILHVLAHGAFRAGSNHAVLYLQDEEGGTRLMFDHELTSMLVRQGIQPRLVYLAACQSATRSTADAYLGLAPKLVRAGVPAVVAMQDRIAVESARIFGAHFFHRLLEHGHVDRAVNQARSTLLTARRSDAGVPVLFMRLRSGQLWGDEADARGQFLVSGKPKAFWTTLVRQIERGRCTPILGPRVHGRALPSPAEIAERWSALHEYPFTNCSELPCVAQYLATNQGEDFVRHEFLDTLMAQLIARLPEEQRPSNGAETLTDLVQTVGWQNLVIDNPNEVHGVLAELNLPLYLTTNVDSSMVEALVARGRDPVRSACRWSEHLDWLDSPVSARADHEPTVERPMVYHFLGTDEEVDSLVLTEDHFFSFLVRICAERDRIPYAIRDAMCSTSLMFVGYSLHDWEFRVLLHGLVRNLSQRRRFKHVAVQLEPHQMGTADPGAVKTFLQQYFQDADINVYWGSTAQFAAELREYWRAATDSVRFEPRGPAASEPRRAVERQAA
jgi:hypothetical protein